jgi:GT2 family glycosyltransferase
VRTLAARLDEAAGVGIVGPLLVLADDPTVVWSEGGGVSRGHPHLLHGGELAADRLGGPPSPVSWVDGTCMMVRRGVFDEVRFDEGYFLYFEDVEICVAAGAKGWGIECVAACTARTSPGVGPTALALWTRNRLRFAWRNSRRSFPRELARVLKHAGGRTAESRLRRRGLMSVATRESPKELYRLRT